MPAGLNQRVSESRRNRGEAGEAGWLHVPITNEDHEKNMAAPGQEAGDEFFHINV
jgi:hypothetical protein